MSGEVEYRKLLNHFGNKNVDCLTEKLLVFLQEHNEKLLLDFPPKPSKSI